jgi:hypothetical protein
VLAALLGSGFGMLCGVSNERAPISSEASLLVPRLLSEVDICSGSARRRLRNTSSFVLFTTSLSLGSSARTSVLPLAAGAAVPSGNCRSELTAAVPSNSGLSASSCAPRPSSSARACRFSPRSGPALIPLPCTALPSTSFLSALVTSPTCALAVGSSSICSRCTARRSKSVLATPFGLGGCDCASLLPRGDCNLTAGEP